MDAGSDSLSYIQDFYDLLNAGNQHPGKPGQLDRHGHGTTMASIIHAVAGDCLKLNSVEHQDGGRVLIAAAAIGFCLLPGMPPRFTFPP